MELLQVIIPEPSLFRILLEDDEEIRIIKYSKIEMDFCDRIVIKDNKSITVQSPLISYRVELDDKSEKQLNKLFTDAYFDTEFTIQTRQARIKVGKYGYIFNVDITAIPDKAASIFAEEKKYKKVIVRLRLETTTISLFDRADEAYEKYNRFDLLDFEK